MTLFLSVILSRGRRICAERFSGGVAVQTGVRSGAAWAFPLRVNSSASLGMAEKDGKENLGL
jgi:hypothetical protein